MKQVWIALAVVVAATVVSVVLRRRRRVDVPTQASYAVPQQLDRADFPAAEPWLVVVFSSATCAVCADVKRKAEATRSPQVAVIEAEYSARRDAHQKYRIEAVPMTLIADRDGVVVNSYVGPVTATDLWAGLAEARQPGSTPSGVVGHCHQHD